MVKVLFVCLGNICRSPTAEGVFRHLVEKEGLSRYIEIDSAGTHAYHIGEAPDARAQSAAAQRDVDLSGLRGRKATARDIELFDYILAMDRANYNDLMAISLKQHAVKIRLFLDYAPDWPEKEVPDPYFGGSGGFERVLDMIEDASRGLLADIRRQHDF